MYIMIRSEDEPGLHLHCLVFNLFQPSRDQKVSDCGKLGATTLSLLQFNTIPCFGAVLPDGTWLEKFIVTSKREHM